MGQEHIPALIKEAQKYNHATIFQLYNQLKELADLHRNLGDYSDRSDLTTAIVSDILKDNLPALLELNICYANYDTDPTILAEKIDAARQAMENTLNLLEEVFTLKGSKKGMTIGSTEADLQEFYQKRTKPLESLINYSAEEITNFLLSVESVKNGLKSAGMGKHIIKIEYFESRALRKNVMSHIKDKLSENPDLVITLAKATSEEKIDIVHELLKDFEDVFVPPQKFSSTGLDSITTWRDDNATQHEWESLIVLHKLHDLVSETVAALTKAEGELATQGIGARYESGESLEEKVLNMRKLLAEVDIELLPDRHFYGQYNERHHYLTSKIASYLLGDSSVAISDAKNALNELRLIKKRDLPQERGLSLDFDTSLGSADAMGILRKLEFAPKKDTDQYSSAPKSSLWKLLESFSETGSISKTYILREVFTSIYIRTFYSANGLANSANPRDTFKNALIELVTKMYADYMKHANSEEQRAAELYFLKLKNSEFDQLMEKIGAEGMSKLQNLYKHCFSKIPRLGLAVKALQELNSDSNTMRAAFNLLDAEDARRREQNLSDDSALAPDHEMSEHEIDSDYSSSEES